MSVIEVPVVTTPAVTTGDLLRRGADVLEEWGWCQHANALSPGGRSTCAADDEAVSFCLYGAMHRAGFDLGVINRHDDSGDMYDRFNRTWESVLGDRTDLVNWNNAPERTKAEVVAKLREAAERAA